MFQNKIPVLAKERGLLNAYALQKALKCSPTMASRLWKGEFNKIGVDTLHRLCELFDCQISDYLFFDGNKLEQS